MRQHVASFDLANTVRMAHKQRPIAFLLVEGETDLYWLQKFVLSSHCEILVSHGRDNAIDAMLQLDRTAEEGALAIVDADFDHIEQRLPASRNCIVTDLHDAQIVQFESRALDQVLLEMGSVQKIKAFEAERGKSIRAVLLEKASVFGALRFLNERQGIGLKFTDLTFSRLVDRSSLEVDRTRVIAAVTAPVRETIESEEVDEQAAVIEAEAYDHCNLCNGHDVVAVLGIALRKLIGTRPATETGVDVLERDLRLAFDRECLENTQMYSDLREWEHRNPDWSVLTQA